jgi:peptidoglycan/xylan/chitin deacetylase (PgdA/CDA1 family)
LTGGKRAKLTDPALHVVMYHYVRDLPNTSFPKIKGMLTSDFRRQLGELQNRYEMAKLDIALDFLSGTYTPSRDLCLLTFDDGLKEHYTDVAPLLIDHKVQGLFFLITACLDEGQLASVHMNHFLMAALDFGEYRTSFLSRLADIDPKSRNLADVDVTLAQRVYRWDTAEVACFKYLFNFVLDCAVRDRILKDLFEEKIGEAHSFARDLYLNAEEAKEMQAGGMIIGGHSHLHKPVSSLSDKELEFDLTTCHKILIQSLRGQPLWPFSYPYGKSDSFNKSTLTRLKDLGFACAFSTEVGSNASRTDAFAIRRVDCKDI